MMARIFLAYDHRGVETGRRIVKWCEEHGHKVDDMGPVTSECVDYPDFAFPAVEMALKFRGQCAGVLICGWGNGMAIAANKVKGARAALCTSSVQARYARLHNNANVLVLSTEATGWGMVEAILEEFLNTKFEGGRHGRRLDKIAKYENEKE